MSARRQTGPLVLAGVLAAAVVAGCTPLDLFGGQEPPVAPPTTSAAPATPATAAGGPTGAADLQTLLTGLGRPVPAGQAVASAESLATALGAAVNGGDDVERVETVVTEAVDVALSTPQGRQAMLAAGQALDGHRFGPPAGSGSATSVPTTRSLALGPDATMGVQLVAAAGEPVRYYFVNGVLNSYADALATRERLAEMLGTDDVTLVYNHSVKELADIEIQACLRAIQRAGLADEIIATDQSWSAWMAQKLNNSVTAGLRGACAVLDGAGKLATGTLIVGALARGALELAVQRTTGADLASSAVNDELVPLLQQDVLAGRRSVVIGHSQGTMFARNAIEQVRAWWEAGADGQRPAPCEGLIATPHPPVGALYISPAFTADNDTRLERYVAMRGDVLATTGVSSSEWTARPDHRQSDPDALGDSIGVHGVANYLLDGSESRGQVTDNIEVLRTALAELQGMDPCPDGSAEPGASSSAEIVSGASEWVVWRALKPFEGIGINVTSKRAYAEDNLASRWSGGGLDPKATFEKELVLSTVFGSKDEAMKELCAGLSDVRMWPLGAGMHGVWQGTPYALGDSVQCPSS